jgi:hypothetical protein
VAAISSCRAEENWRRWVSWSWGERDMVL